MNNTRQNITRKWLKCVKNGQCIQALLYIYQQANTWVDTLLEEEIPFDDLMNFLNKTHVD